MRRASFTSLILVVVAANACSAEAASPPSTSAATTHAATQHTASTAAAPAPPMKAAVVPAGPRGVVLTRYEALRAALADDNAVVGAADLEALRTAVAALVAEKAAGAADLDKGVAGLTAAMTAATKDAAGALVVDTKAVRLAFGELSRGVVAVVAADNALQTGRFLFECPMARGYQRWVQTAPAMMNPYMGKRMLDCGSAVAAWRVEG